MSPLLEASRISLPGRLEPTDLRVGRSELVCLIGPNGSGKTSLLHALAGVGGPAGEIRIDGEAPGVLAPDRRMRLFSYLPASRELIWPVTGKDLIALGLPAGETADWIVDALELGEIADRRVDRLSTGERSRLMIGRALAAKPKLLLLDEPVSNLDPLWQIRFMDLLKRLLREGRSAIVAIHDLDLARVHADRLIVMQDGRIADDGRPAEIFAGETIPSVFGIEKAPDGAWRPVSRPADPRSSR